MIDQNIIILVLLLISVLVSFYALYLSLENNRKIKIFKTELLNFSKNDIKLNSTQEKCVLQPNLEDK